MNLDPSVLGCSAGGSRAHQNPLLRFPLDDGRNGNDHDDDIMTKAKPFSDPLNQLQQRVLQPPRSFETILDHAVDIALVKFTPLKKEESSSDDRTIPLKCSSAAAAAAATGGGGGIASEATTTTNTTTSTSKVIPGDNDNDVSCVTGRIRMPSSSFNGNDRVDGREELIFRRTKKMMKRKTM